MNPTDIFLHKILYCEDMGLEQTAVHEAGHRIMWMGVYPDVKTRYIVTKDGHPGVGRVDRKHESWHVSDMSLEDASRYMYIKLGGIASEMIYLGIEGHSDEIASWIASDCMSPAPLIDWKDDREHGGDVAQAVDIICIKAAENLATVDLNLRRVLNACVKAMLDNKEEYERECAAALRFFGKHKIRL